MNEYLQATVTVLSLVNPAVAASIFVRLEKDRSQSQKFVDASKSSIAISLVVLL